MNTSTDIDWNQHRAERMRQYLQPYAYEQSTNLETALSDTLANLRHFANFNGYDFDEALEVAKEHFDAEIEADGVE